ncbi:uncharacterized protein LOC143891832 [Tasmannia lanceolata]|uniref:uncharacterized protein LOC143891832 n=1 Tax=Tasmannia lanceolata TaxID=3420 RepID=UPI0040633F94
MEDFRSKSYNDGWMQMGSYKTMPVSGYDLRSYSTSYASAQQTHIPKQIKLKKVKTTGSSSSKIWNLKDPEFQRKKRVASYKLYAVEGKMKGSFRKSFRWLKNRYTQMLYGFW